MKILHCVILFLPLALFGANTTAQNAESRQNTNGGGGK